MSNKRTACYARVSTVDQSTGLESQVRVLKKYCEQNEILNAEFFTDEGISGTKTNRPALDRLMAAVENDEITAVVVYSFSRFARSTTHLLTALQVFKRKGVHFVSLTEKIDTNSAVGIAIFSLTGQSIPEKTSRVRQRERATIGFSFDPSHCGPARLTLADES
jgi:DNA invertase Pin-like site-specific DNA recombinase